MARPPSTTYQLPSGPGAALALVLARNVKKLRLSQKLEQAQLAEKAGLSRRTLQRVEGREKIADLNTLAQLAAALGKTPAALIL